MKGALRRIVGLGFTVGCAAASLWWYLADPVHFLDDDKAYVFVGANCGYSAPIVDQLKRDPQVSSLVVPLLATDDDEALSSRVCALAAQDLKSRAPWFGLISDERLCGKLSRWSTATYDRAFIKIPAWLVGGHPLHWRDEHAQLKRLGLRVDLQDRRAPIKLQEQAGPSDEPTPRRATPPPGPGGHWRGLSIGY